MRHGTTTKYGSGCRCDDCVYAHKLETMMASVDEPALMKERRIGPLRKTKQRRFPARDLVLFVGQPNSTVLSDMMSIERSTVSAWLRRGVCLTVYEADRYAIKAGTHPAVVWGESWYDDDMA